MATFKHLLRTYRPYRTIAILSIVATGLFQIADLVVPYAIGQILNVLSQQSIDKPIQTLTSFVANSTPFQEGKALSLGVLLGVIFLVNVVRAPIQPWLVSWFHWAIALKSRRDQSQAVTAKILSLPLEFYDEHNPGRIAGRVARGLTNQTWTYPEIAGQLLPKLMLVFGIFLLILFIEWRIAIAFLISFLLILSLTMENLRRLIRREKNLDRYMEGTESHTSELITNIKTVKAFATEAEEFKRQERRYSRELKVIINRIHKGYTILETKQKALIQLCVFLVLVSTLIATLQGKISLGHFVTTLTVSSMAYAELEPMSALAEIFARRYASMLRFHDFMEHPLGKDATSLALVNHHDYRFTGKVEFSHLSFGYNSERPVLKDINFLIEPYQTIALVGRSGSGKSTLVKLLFRYFEPNQGRILIDGEDIQDLNIASYRRRLAIVHQEVDVFNGTLLSNLTYGNPHASQEEIESACRIARVDEFIQDFPDGYYTVVGERGVRLSGGQRQRLGIARALLVDPDVLVFDEATSSLDYESERSIQLAMKSIFGTRTTIIIAHRLSTIREADKIVVLDGGRIAEVGSHEELLKQKGLYQRLHYLQERGAGNLQV